MVLKSADERMQEERGLKNLDGYNYDSSAPTNSRHDNYFQPDTQNFQHIP